MFGFLKDKLKKTIGALTRKAEEKEKIEERAVEKAEEVIEEKLEHKEPATEAKPEIRQENILEPVQEELRPELEEPVPVEPEIPTPPPSIEHEHKTLAPAKKEKVKKRVFSLTKKTLEDEELNKVLWDLQVGLLESDVAVETAEKICSKIREDLNGSEVKRGHVEELVEKSLRDAVADVLQQEEVDLIKEIKKAKRPYKLVFLGFNGAGKTTTIARLAYALEKSGLKCVLAAGDTWRAAAIQQLEKHGEALGVRVVKQDYGSDATAVIYDAVNYAETHALDVVLADTAGRAHTNKNLMDELHKIMRVIKPDKKILIVDSLTGNDAVEQARAFATSVGVDGVILTKMDVNEKGGAALSVAHTIGKPIYYMGIGQAYGDLERFDSQKILKALLD
ncbi:MAG: signal recognition particle-docking protein FtsY [Candidatus Aenigmatarchaeota archaeon]|nr:MAG: signal recognition particle-docking protein FtsY [Candidatus Aenigmarchaeota archaeon]